MATWKTIEQSGGGVAVVMSAVHGATARALGGTRPARVTALLSDHGLAGRGPRTAARVQLDVRSGDGPPATAQQLEVGPISVGDALDISVQIAAPERDQPIVLQARLDGEAGAPWQDPCYVAMFPSAPAVDIGALSVIDGELRLDGAPIHQLDYALVRLVGAERPDLAAMSDLGDLHERLLATYLTGNGAEIDKGLRTALDAIDAHLWLLAADRKRLAAAFQREHDAWFGQPLEAIPRGVRSDVTWSDFVAMLPITESVEPFPKSAGALPEAPVETGVEHAPKPVQWNTRILDGESALTELFVTIGHAYTIETGLDPEVRPGALVSSTLAPGGLPDGTRVTFEVSCPQPILRDLDNAEGTPAAQVVHTGTYDGRTGSCPPARFGLTPVARGRIPLTLSVGTSNAIRASTLLTLQAEPSATQPAELSPAPPAGLAVSSRVQVSPSIAVSPAVFTGYPAQLLLRLTETGQLVLSDGVVTEKPRDPATPQKVLFGGAIIARKQLVELSRDYRRDLTRSSAFALADAPMMRLRMAKIGARLHRQFFGRPGDPGTDLDVQHLAQVIADTPLAGTTARLQIAAAFQPFPWAVFYDGAYRGKPLTDDPRSVDLACFWGHRFRIDRMIMGHARTPRAPALPSSVRVQACLNPHLDDEPGAKALGVRVVDHQRKLFDAMPGVTAHPWIESTDGFVTYLESKTACELLYVFCHASAAVTWDDLFTYSDQAPDTQAKLVFDPPPAPPVDVAAMQEHRMAPLLDRPLVFLNACSTTAGDEAFQAPLLEQFLDRWGAAGVLGTDWEVPSVFADAFAYRLLDHFLRARKPLGEAFWLASHEAFDEGNPFPLVYALYAQPEFTIAAVPRHRED